MIKYWVLLLSFKPFVTVAQPFDLGSWNILNLKYSVNNQWSLREVIKYLPNHRHIPRKPPTQPVLKRQIHQPNKHPWI